MLDLAQRRLLICLFPGAALRAGPITPHHGILHDASRSLRFPTKFEPRPAAGVNERGDDYLLQHLFVGTPWGCSYSYSGPPPRESQFRQPMALVCCSPAFGYRGSTERPAPERVQGSRATVSVRLAGCFERPAMCALASGPRGGGLVSLSAGFHASCAGRWGSKPTTH